jgi:hypothetical protein
MAAKKPPQSNPDPEAERVNITAYHEAGHAVAAVVLGLELGRVSVEEHHFPDGVCAAGVTRVRIDLPAILANDETYAMPFIVQALCGVFAQLLGDERAMEGRGFENDFAQAKIIAILALCDPKKVGGDIDALTKETERKERAGIKLAGRALKIADKFVKNKDNKDSIRKVARRLIKFKSLTSQAVISIVTGAPRERKKAAGSKPLDTFRDHADMLEDEYLKHATPALRGGFLTKPSEEQAEVIRQWLASNKIQAESDFLEFVFRSRETKED